MRKQGACQIWQIESHDCRLASSRRQTIQITRKLWRTLAKKTAISIEPTLNKLCLTLYLRWSGPPWRLRLSGETFPQMKLILRAENERGVGGDEQNRPRQHGNESGQYVRWNVGDNLGIDMCTLDDVLGGDSTCFLVTSRCYSHRLVIEESISILFTFPQFLFGHYFATIIIQISSCNSSSCSSGKHALWCMSWW